MYFCYIDESGHCGMKYDSNQPVEVLVGVISDASKIHKTSREHKSYLNLLLRDHGINIPEIKASELFRGRKEWAKMDAKARKDVLKKLIVMMDNRKCKLIVCPIDSIKFFEKKRTHNIAQKLMFPYEAGALNVLLSLQKFKYGKRNNKGKTVVIFDEQREHDKNLVSILSNDLSFTDGFTGFVSPKSNKKTLYQDRLCQIVDIPFFSKSEHSQLIQVADIVAFVVARYIQLKSYEFRESFTGEGLVIESFYKDLQPMLIQASHINPKVKGDALCELYEEIRPKGWTPKSWLID